MGVFANVLHIGQNRAASLNPPEPRPVLGAWLLDLLHRRALREPRLAVVERISLAPRQTVALIEADGQRLLVAIASDGAPAFYPLQPLSKQKPAHRSRKPAPQGDNA